MATIQAILRIDETVNPYEVLALKVGATADAIKKQFRKLSLTYHPDKCQDKRAADVFDKIKKANEILKDDKERAAIDEKLLKKRKVQQQKAERETGLDKKRRMFQKDLEAREAKAKESTTTTYQRSVPGSSKDKAKADEARRRNAVLKESILREKEDAHRPMAKLPGRGDVLTAMDSARTEGRAVKLKWSRSKGPSQSDDTLVQTFRQYGHIVKVVMGKKGKSAVVAFETEEGAIAAVQGESVEGALFTDIFRVGRADSRLSTPLTSHTSSAATQDSNLPSMLVGESVPGAAAFIDFEAMILEQMLGGDSGVVKDADGKTEEGSDN